MLIWSCAQHRILLYGFGGGYNGKGRFLSREGGHDEPRCSLALLHFVDHAIRGELVVYRGLNPKWNHSGWPFNTHSELSGVDLPHGEGSPQANC